MIINKSAWHYRVQAYSGETLWAPWVPPRDLCRYFWRLMLSPWLCLAALLARMFPEDRDGSFVFLAWSAAWCAGVGLASLTLLVPAIDPTGETACMALILLGLFPFTLGLVLAIQGVILVVVSVDACRPLFGRSSKEPPSIFKEWAHDRKAGVCPIIEYREPPE